MEDVTQERVRYISIELTPGQFDRLSEKAGGADVSNTEYVRRLLMEDLAK